MENRARLAIVVPCYNEQEVLPLFYEEVTKVLSTMDVDYEELTIYHGLTIQDFQNRSDDKEIEMRIDAIIEYIDTYPIKYQLIANSRGDLIVNN